MEATFCQPWRGSFGSRSFNLLVPGLTPPASASQLGILAPTVFKRSVESATDPKHMEDRVATPFTTLLATSGIISKLSAQLPPMCGVMCPLRVAQSQTSQCQRHGGGLVVAWVQRLCLEHFAETLEDLLVVLFSKLEGEFGSHCPQEEIRSSGCAKHRAACTSGTCGIISSRWSCSNPFWDKKLRMKSGCPTGAPNTLRPCWAVGNPWSPRHTTACGSCILAAAERPATPVGSVPLAFHNLVFTQMDADACAASELSFQQLEHLLHSGWSADNVHVVQEYKKVSHPEATSTARPPTPCVDQG